MTTWVSSLGFAQGFAKSVEASAIPRTTPAAIERMSPSCTPDHAPIDRSSAANFGRREKKRKLCSDAVAAPNPQAEVHTIPPSEPKGNSTFVQPYVSNKGAAEVSSIPPGLASKLSLIGGVEVLRDLKHTLFRLRSPSSKGSLVPKHEIDALPTNGTPTRHWNNLERRRLRCSGSRRQVLRKSRPKQRFPIGSFTGIARGGLVSADDK